MTKIKQKKINNKKNNFAIWSSDSQIKVLNPYLRASFFRRKGKYHCDFSPTFITTLEISWCLEGYEFALVEGLT